MLPGQTLSVTANAVPPLPEGEASGERAAHAVMLLPERAVSGMGETKERVQKKHRPSGPHPLAPPLGELSA